MTAVADDSRFRIAVDTGGTFTDVVISREDGKLAVGKALTTYGRIADGFRASLDRAANALDRSGDQSHNGLPRSSGCS